MKKLFLMTLTIASSYVQATNEALHLNAKIEVLESFIEQDKEKLVSLQKSVQDYRAEIPLLENEVRKKQSERDEKMRNLREMRVSREMLINKSASTRALINALEKQLEDPYVRSESFGRFFGLRSAEDLELFIADPNFANAKLRNITEAIEMF